MFKIFIDITRHTLFKLVLGMLAFAIIGASVVFLSEGSINQKFQDIGDAVWRALVTMTTVGYGDKVPITIAGRIIGILIAIFGLSLISIFTATVSSIFIAGQLIEGGRGFTDKSNANGRINPVRTTKIEENDFLLTIGHGENAKT